MGDVVPVKYQVHFNSIALHCVYSCLIPRQTSNRILVVSRACRTWLRSPVRSSDDRTLRGSRSSWHADLAVKEAVALMPGNC